jgi:hypothetical protein
MTRLKEYGTILGFFLVGGFLQEMTWQKYLATVDSGNMSLDLMIFLPPKGLGIRYHFWRMQQMWPTRPDGEEKKPQGQREACTESST